MDTLSDQVLAHLREVAEAPDLTGTKYEVLRPIGRGGMGTVYLARDHELGREVALKVLESGAEARILALLEHPGIVPVHDAGTLPDGRCYYAMKFVQGTRLDQYAASTASQSERLRLFLRICEPVAFAHAQGLVHRDLKPANIMSGPFGEVLVLDWGIAKAPDAAVENDAGTPGYMAPEGGPIDARMDIYALGKILEFLLRGSAPSKPLRAIWAKAAHSDREQRYLDVQELSADVALFLDDGRVTAYRESIVERGARWLARHKTLSALVAAYLLARILLFISIRR